MFNKILNRFGNILYKGRYVISIVFVIIFGIVIYGQNKSKIAYSFVEHNKVNEIFKNETTVVIVYKNEDEDNIKNVIGYLSTDTHVISIQSYYNTLGVELDYNNMAYYINQDPEYVKGTYKAYFESDDVDNKLIPLYDYMVFLNQLINSDPYKDMVSEEERQQMATNLNVMTEGKNQLIGEKHSRLIFEINYEPETKEISKFFNNLDDKLDELFNNKYYLVGDEAMSHELSSSFYNEYLFISILSAIAIFIVIAISFRKLIVPLLLISIIECSVFITLTYMAITDMSMYFLALIIVQCMLMGSMVDYGILMSNYYQDKAVDVEKDNILEMSKIFYDSYEEEQNKKA